MKVISKKELIDAIAKKTNLSKKDSQNALAATIESIVQIVKKGDKVALIGFGSFFPQKKKASTKRNPKTGEPIKIPAKTVFKFKASKKLNEAKK